MHIQKKCEAGIQLVSTDSEIFEKRRLFIEGEITNEKAIEFSKSVMSLLFDNNTLPIQIFINSPGGNIDAGLFILDILTSLPVPVETYCFGQAYSMGAILFLLSPKRFILKHSKIMLHEPIITTPVSQNTTEIQKNQSRLIEQENLLLSLLTERTKISKNKLKQYFKDETFFTADECLKNNFADEIIEFKDIKEIDLWKTE